MNNILKIHILIILNYQLLKYGLVGNIIYSKLYICKLIMKIILGYHLAKEE